MVTENSTTMATSIVTIAETEIVVATVEIADDPNAAAEVVVADAVVAVVAVAVVAVVAAAAAAAIVVAVAVAVVAVTNAGSRHFAEPASPPRIGRGSPANWHSNDTGCQGIPEPAKRAPSCDKKKLSASYITAPETEFPKLSC